MPRVAGWALVLLAGWTAGACSSKGPSPLADCDAFVSAIEKAATCPALSSDARTRLTTSAKTMRATIEQISQGGGPSKAPPELVEYVRDACRAQLASLESDPNLAACPK